jgi:hypothetical protein
VGYSTADGDTVSSGLGSIDVPCALLRHDRQSSGCS